MCRYGNLQLIFKNSDAFLSMLLFSFFSVGQTYIFESPVGLTGNVNAEAENLKSMPTSDGSRLYFTRDFHSGNKGNRPATICGLRSPLLTLVHIRFASLSGNFTCDKNNRPKTKKTASTNGVFRISVSWVTSP